MTAFRIAGYSRKRKPKENNTMQKLTGYENSGSGLIRHYQDTTSRSCMKSPRSALVIFSVVLIVGALVFTRFLDTTVIFGNSGSKQILRSKTMATDLYKVAETPKTPEEQIDIPVNCTAYNLTQTCPSDYPTSSQREKDGDSLPRATCPDYFRWIHEDLRPWARTGITKEMVERARQTANFKLVIIDGRAYLETYEKAFQTRDVYTIWGILQLLRRYPGKLPDLEIMFDCVDWPVVSSADYSGPNATIAPPLFRYCGNDDTLDIVFPDWSFWGWPEVNLKPWEILLGELKEGNERIKWMNREPYAYWKGNPTVAETRQDLLKCNVTEQQEWNARLYSQDWGRESQEGYRKSDLAAQCTHRYKIYIEGSAWSVSEKYILACDSVTLLVKPHYYDFFTRGLVPLQHYWPIKEDDKCRSIKFAVEWGNNNKKRAQDIGKTSSDFIQEELKMDFVYDYMFHLLNSYANLLNYKPSKSAQAIELCPESMVCGAEGLVKKFMIDSLVKAPANTNPCDMPLPFDPPSLHSRIREKESSIEQVNSWEKSYWGKQNRQP